jgi:hypothetical protein
MWKVTLECGVVGAKNTAHVACDELGLAGRAGLARCIIGVGLKTTRTHAGSGGCGGRRHAGGTGGASGVPTNGFERPNGTRLAHGVGIPEVSGVACTVQDRR